MKNIENRPTLKTLWNKSIKSNQINKKIIEYQNYINDVNNSILLLSSKLHLKVILFQNRIKNMELQQINDKNCFVPYFMIDVTSKLHFKFILFQNRVELHKKVIENTKRISGLSAIQVLFQ